MNNNIIKWAKDFLSKYSEQVTYLFFGVLTTIVNYSCFALLRVLWGDQWIHLINIATFIVATLFAYVTNKMFVFQHRSWRPEDVLRELTAFFASRISSFLLELMGLYVCVEFFRVGQYDLIIMDGTMAAKVILSFVAVIINYFLSKFFVFKKRNRG